MKIKKTRTLAIVMLLLVSVLGISFGSTYSEETSMLAEQSIEKDAIIDCIEGDRLLAGEGRWIYLYQGPHRPPGAGLGPGAGYDEMFVAITPDLSDISVGEITAAAIYNWPAAPNSAHLYIWEDVDFGDGQNGTEVAHAYHEAEGGWHEYEFNTTVQIKPGKTYAFVVHYFGVTGHPQGVVQPSVYGGDWRWRADLGWHRLRDLTDPGTGYPIDYSHLLEIRVLAPPTIDTLAASEHRRDPNNVTLNAGFDMGVAENVTVYFQYNKTGEALEGRLGEQTYNATEAAEAGGIHSLTITDLEPYQTYDYRAMLEYEDEGGNITTFSGKIEHFTISPINITVVDADTGDPMPGVENVSITAPLLQWNKVFETGEDGNIFGVIDAPTGIEGIDFIYSVPITTYYQGTSGNFTGVAPMEYTIELTPRTEWPVIIGPIMFYDADEDDEFAVYGASVTLVDEGNAVSDMYGKATVYVDRVPVGEEFTAMITHPDYNPKEVTFTLEDMVIGSGPIYLTDDPIEFTIGPIVNEDGEPLENIMVRVQLGLFDDWYEQDITGENGTVEFSVVHFYPEDVDLYISLDDRNEIYLTKTTTEGEPGTQMIMQRRPTVTVGPIVNRKDQPIPNVYVSLIHQIEEIEVGRAYSGLDGMATFTVNFLTEGVYFTANMTHDDFDVPEEAYFSGSNSGEIKLYVGPYGRVQVGPIRDVNNQFVQGASVALFYQNSIIDTVSTNVNGIAMFDVEMDPEGKSYSYRIRHTDLDEDVEGTFTGTHAGSVNLDIGEVPTPPAPPEEDDEEGISTTILAGAGILIIIIIIVIVVMMMKKKPGEVAEEEEPLFEEEEEPLFEEEEEPLFEEEEEPLFEEEEEPLFEEEEEPLFEEEEEPLFEEEEEL